MLHEAAGRHMSMERRNTIKGLLFIMPWILGFIFFALYPISASLYYSLTSYDLIRPSQFVGLQNYVELFSQDNMMGIVTRNTFWWVGIAVPIGIVVAFLLANLLSSEIRWRAGFRALFFVPSVIPAAVSSVVWFWVLNPQFGIINGAIKSLGLKTIPFLGRPALAKPTLTMVHCWAQGGAVVIFLAALQDVPRELYEAAVVDGANAWHRFWYITIPMCAPAGLFVLITGLIGGFQSFTLPYLLTGGGPNNATEFLSLYLYRNAFIYVKMGYASALAWILFVVVLLLTLLVFRLSARGVHYYGA